MKRTKLKVTAVLSSEPYGDEEFRYDSRKELLAGASRLLTACMEATRKDRIDRDVILRIESVDDPKEQKPTLWANKRRG